MKILAALLFLLFLLPASVLGARPLRCLIQDTLEVNLSKLILQNKLTKGQTFKADSSFLA